MEGYLTKRGHLIQNWKVRWFVLEQCQLSYYTDQTKSSQKGTSYLTPATTVETHSDLGIHKHVLKIKNTSADSELLISADSEQTKQNWLQALLGQISQVSRAQADEQKYAASIKRGDVVSVERGRRFSRNDLPFFGLKFKSEDVHDQLTQQDKKHEPIVESIHEHKEPTPEKEKKKLSTKSKSNVDNVVANEQKPKAKKIVALDDMSLLPRLSELTSVSKLESTKMPRKSVLDMLPDLSELDATIGNFNKELNRRSMSYKRGDVQNNANNNNDSNNDSSTNITNKENNNSNKKKGVKSKSQVPYDEDDLNAFCPLTPPTTTVASASTSTSSTAQQSAGSIKKKKNSFTSAVDSNDDGVSKSVSNDDSQQHNASDNHNSNLEDNWIEVQTEDGKTYYYHKISRVARWDKPEKHIMEAMEARLRETQEATEKNLQERKLEMERQIQSQQEKEQKIVDTKIEIDKIVKKWRKNKKGQEQSFPELLRDLPLIMPDELLVYICGTTHKIIFDSLVSLSTASNPNEVKKTYMKVVRFIHPDKLPSSLDLEAKLLTEQVFIVLSEKFDLYRKAHEL